MTQRIFGWDLPPGCTQRHIDEAAGAYDEEPERDEAPEPTEPPVIVELLAALKEVTPLLANYCRQQNNHALWPAVERARAAIERAESSCCTFHATGGEKNLSCGGDAYVKAYDEGELDNRGRK